MKKDPEFVPAFLKSYSDSSFTNPHEMVLPEEPPDCMGNFTHMGAKYWGFETDRHRATRTNKESESFSFDATAHHWINIGLKHRAKIQRINISTRWFTGNQVPRVSVELSDRVTGITTEIISQVSLEPDTEQSFSIKTTRATDCHIKCFHEGGIARVNLFGEDFEPLYDRHNLLLDATISRTSNEHYGKPSDAVNGNRQVNHMAGWESARTGFGESTLFHLPKPAVIESIVVDTYLHRLNSPLSCHIFAADLTDSVVDDALASLPKWKLVLADGREIIPDNFQDYMHAREYPESQFEIKLHRTKASCWQPLISFAKLHPDTWHEFEQLESSFEANTIFYMHYPNGGVHGLKMFGRYSSQ